MIIVNRSTRAVIYGDTILIPAKPVDVPESSDELKNLYPAIDKMLTDGTIEVLSEDQAAEAEKALEAQTIAELQAYADAHNIDLAGAAKKGDILAAIKKAQAGA